MYIYQKIMTLNKIKNTYAKFQKMENIEKFSITYITISSLCFIGFIYNDGRNALIKYRKTTTERDYNKDIEVIKNNLNIFNNMCKSTRFLWTFGQYITHDFIPMIIYKTTKE